MKIKKREDMAPGKEVLVRITAIFLSLVFAGLVIRILGYDPIGVFSGIIKGALGSEIRIKQTILKGIPLIITSLGILVAFKMKFWNIGGEGQIMMGALAAAFAAFALPGLPKPVLLLLMMTAAIIAGGFWAFIPAFFKVKFGVNETIFTLMLNYIAIKYVTYLQHGPWKSEESQGFPKIDNFSENGLMPDLFGVHAGWLVALVLVVFIHILINHTKKGYEISVVGESINTAKYAGMNVNSIVLFAMFISGGLCGITGMIQASAIEHTLTYGLSAGYGFTAIITAWLAQLNAILTLFVCLVFAVLLQGAAYIQIALQIPASAADMIQAIILFFVLGSEFFIRYQVRLTFFERLDKVEVRE